MDQHVKTMTRVSLYLVSVRSETQVIRVSTALKTKKKKISKKEIWGEEQKMEMQTKIKSGVLVFQNLKQDPEEIIFGEVEENDLSYWEFINNSSDSDVDEVISISDASWHSSLSSSPKEKSSFPDLMIPDSGGDHLPLDSEVLRDGYGEPYTADQEEDVGGVGGGGDDDDVEEEEEEEHGYDLDDELVPRSLTGKFGRQRIRKLGKRSFAKMNTSKKSPFKYMKPGCVHGKHGLGLKHNF